MVYFLVNNDFHVHDVKNLAAQLGYGNCSLISVPYRMDVPRELPFAHQYVFERCEFLLKQVPSNPRKLLSIHRDNFSKRKQLDALRPTRNDTLFVFTECELMNMFCIRKFHKAGAKIFLIEDGMASYIYFNRDSDRIPLRWKLVTPVYKLLYGLKGFYPYYASSMPYHMLSEKYYSGACFFTPISIRRKLPVIWLDNGEKPLRGLDPENAMVLTQPLGTESLKIDKTILDNVHANFKRIYLKCHPDEFRDQKTYNALKQLCAQYDNVEFVESGAIMEDLIEQYRVGYAISPFSSTLPRLQSRGVIPVYVYHLLNDIKAVSIDNYLKLINYNFATKWEDIKPGYSSFANKVDGLKTSIKDLIS